MPGHTASDGEDDRARDSDDEPTSVLPAGPANRPGRGEAEASGLTAEAPTQSATPPPEADGFSVQPRRRFRRPDQGSERKSRPKGPGSFARELPVLLLIAFILALLIKSLLVQ